MTANPTDLTNANTAGPDERAAAPKPAGPSPSGATSRASGVNTSHTRDNANTAGPDERAAAPKPAGPSPSGATSRASGVNISREWPLWEVFVRPKAGLDHKHCGSLHAADSRMALQLAREVYTRRQEGVSVWIVRSDQIVASDPADKAMLFDPMEDKVYRHPTFYELPPEVGHI